MNNYITYNEFIGKLYEEFKKYENYCITEQNYYSYNHFINDGYYNCNFLDYNGTYSSTNSFKWLKSQIGYNPIWLLKLNKSILSNKSLFIDCYNAVCSYNKDYIFVVKQENEDIVTDFYNWVDVHYIFNDASREEYNKYKHLLSLDSFVINKRIKVSNNKNSIAELNDIRPIQTLKQELNKNNIVAIYKIDWQNYIYNKIL